MKKLLFLFVSIATLVACSTSDDAGSPEQNLEFEESLALRINLEEIRTQFGDSERMANELCFNFEYPIDVAYNDGSEVTVTDFDNLLELLLAETVESHIIEIAFPFNVILAEDGSTQTIDDETSFQSLIDACGYDFITVAEVLAVVDECFTINYPLVLVVNDEEQTFNSQQEAEDFFTNNNDDIVSVTFSYPLSVTFVEDGTTLEITDDFELVNLITNTCDVN